MARVINPVQLIRKYLEMQGYNQSPRNVQEEKDLHSGILMGAAILLNNLNELTNYCWNKEYGSNVTIIVILEAVKELEEEIGCYNQEQKTNEHILLEKYDNILKVEEELGTKSISLLD